MSVAKKYHNRRELWDDLLADSAQAGRERREFRTTQIYRKVAATPELAKDRARVADLLRQPFEVYRRFRDGFYGPEHEPLIRRVEQAGVDCSGLDRFDADGNAIRDDGDDGYGDATD